MGLTLYEENGNLSNGPFRKPLLTSLSISFATVDLSFKADCKFLHFLVTSSMLETFVSKPNVNPSHKYCTKSLSG